MVKVPWVIIGSNILRGLECIEQDDGYGFSRFSNGLLIPKNLIEKYTSGTPSVKFRARQHFKPVKYIRVVSPDSGQESFFTEEEYGFISGQNSQAVRALTNSDYSIEILSASGDNGFMKDFDGRKVVVFESATYPLRLNVVVINLPRVSFVFKHSEVVMFLVNCPESIDINISGGNGNEDYASIRDVLRYQSNNPSRLSGASIGIYGGHLFTALNRMQVFSHRRVEVDLNSTDLAGNELEYVNNQIRTFGDINAINALNLLAHNIKLVGRHSAYSGNLGLTATAYLNRYPEARESIGLPSNFGREMIDSKNIYGMRYGRPRRGVFETFFWVNPGETNSSLPIAVPYNNALYSTSTWFLVRWNNALETASSLDDPQQRFNLTSGRRYYEKVKPRFLYDDFITLRDFI